MDLVFSRKKIAIVFVIRFLALNCFGGFGSNAQLLPEDEVLYLALYRRLRRQLHHLRSHRHSHLQAYNLRRNLRVRDPQPAPSVIFGVIYGTQTLTLQSLPERFVVRFRTHGCQIHDGVRNHGHSSSSS